MIIFFTFPVILLLLSPLVEKAPIGWWRLSLATIAFAGLALSPSAPAPVRSTCAALRWRPRLARRGDAVLRRTRPVRQHAPNLVCADCPCRIPAARLSARRFAGWRQSRGARSAHVTSTGFVAVLAMALLYVFTFFSDDRLYARSGKPVAPLFNLEPVTTMGLAAFVLGEKLAVNSMWAVRWCWPRCSPSVSGIGQKPARTLDEQSLREPIPVNIVIGFLGAGKTTLLSRLLKDPGLAGALVIVNELGEIGLDHALWSGPKAR